MFVLQIDYTISDFDAWKKVFDSDPAGRERSGVRRHRILRGMDNPNLAIVELEFDRREQPEQLLKNLKPVWDKAKEQKLLLNATARITELVEVKEAVTA